jgi:hypothetical protein
MDRDAVLCTFFSLLTVAEVVQGAELRRKARANEVKHLR